jgi:hypothetical protein
MSDAHPDVQAALAAIAAVQAADPEQQDGRAAEARYGEQVAVWVGRLVGEPSTALAIAARAQHFERWAIPRSAYPNDRAGYLRWRIAVHRRQGERVRAVLAAAGLPAPLAERVGMLIAKQAPAGDAEGQALEDAACLTFLEHEWRSFIQDHPTYDDDKLITIIRKTWRKMSPAARALAGTIAMPADLAALVGRALAP